MAKTVERAKEIGSMVTQVIVKGLNETKASANQAVVFKYRLEHFTLNRKPGRSPDPFPVELHAMRLGETILTNNPFELYLDYGLEI